MRILFVGMTDSIHTARWINQIVDQTWDVHLFPVYAATPSPEFRNITLYGLALFRPKCLDKSVRYIGLLPIGRGGNIIERLIYKKFPRIWEFCLEFVMKLSKPEIVHSLEFQHGAYLTLPVMRKERMRRNSPPRWIVSNWGSDIFLFGKLSKHRKLIQQILKECDYYSCECERDIKLAQDIGLSGKVLPVFPNTGGFDLELIKQRYHLEPTSQRQIILLKGYQHWAGRALVGLRALSFCADEIKQRNYRIAIYSTFPDVEIAAELFEQTTGIPVEIIPKCSHEEMLGWFGKARIYIGLSISDAISTSLLEAIVMGAFPIQSFTSCGNEWIINGESGFLVPPEDPDIIAEFIRAALIDDDLVQNAGKLNNTTALKRLEYHNIKAKVISLYASIT
jgi:glycosyltransferase involved in cell wall biosynthesis